MSHTEIELEYLNSFGFQKSDDHNLHIVRILENSESNAIKYLREHPLPTSSQGCLFVWSTNPVSDKKEFIIILELPKDEEIVLPADKYRIGLN